MRGLIPHTGLLRLIPTKLFSHHSWFRKYKEGLKIANLWLDFIHVDSRRAFTGLFILYENIHETCGVTSSAGKLGTMFKNTLTGIIWVNKLLYPSYSFDTTMSISRTLTTQILSVSFTAQRIICVSHCFFTTYSFKPINGWDIFTTCCFNDV